MSGMGHNNSESSTKEQIAPIEVGDKVSNFSVPGVCDGEIKTYSLQELTANGPVLIGVYPMDFNEVCTRQMCLLSDMNWYEYKNNLSIVGINTHGPYSHMKLAEQEDIDYPLLCDMGGKVLESLGVLQEEYAGFDRVPHRSIFLVDSEGIVQFRWIADDNLDEDTDFGVNPITEAIKAL